MQEYMRHHGRTHPALRRALVRVRELSRLQHAGVQPLADEPQYPPSIAPLRDKLSQVVPVEIVEKSPDIRIDSPGDGQLPALFTQLVQRLMLTVPLPEAVGKGMKVLIKDGLYDHHHHSLDHLVLEAGFAYRPLLPIVLLDPYPFDGRRHLPIVAPPLVQVSEVVVHVVG